MRIALSTVPIMNSYLHVLQFNVALQEEHALYCIDTRGKSETRHAYETIQQSKLKKKQIGYYERGPCG